MTKAPGNLSLKFSEHISLQILKLKITTAIHLTAAGLSLMLVKEAMDMKLLFAHKHNMSLWEDVSPTIA